MNKTAKILIIIFVAVIAAGLVYSICAYEPEFGNESDRFAPEELTLNYVKDPVGIDPNEATFSWKMKSDATGISQTAYRIVVSEREDFSGKPYWDSGKKYSSSSVCIPYSGVRLAPETRYFWKVTVWDDKNEYRSSSETAFFETGSDDKILANASFICETASGFRFSSYSIEFDAEINKNALGLMLDVRSRADYLLWQFNIADHGCLYLRKHFFSGGSYTIDENDVSGFLSKDITYGDSFKVRIEADNSVIKTYIDGVLVDSTDHKNDFLSCFGFRFGAGESGYVDNIRIDAVSADNARTAENGILLNADFDDGVNIFSEGSVSGGRLFFEPQSGEYMTYLSFDGKEQQEKSGAVMFRKSFVLSYDDIENELSKVRLYATALGNFNVFINGKRIGTDELKPGWTDYTKRVQYFTYDVKDALVPGENVICAFVSSGWWNGAVSFGTYGYRDNAFLCRLSIEDSYGNKTDLFTDDSWQWNRDDCPVTEASIYDGETYDARLSATVYMPDEFIPESWNSVSVFDGFNGSVSPASGTPVRIRTELNRAPSSVSVYSETEDNGSDFGCAVISRKYSASDDFILNPGETCVIDFGQNMVGWPEITVSGNRGAAVMIRFGEMLNDSGLLSRGNDGPAGSVYRANYRGAKSFNKYILGGSGTETYHTSYSFYGYRYLSVTVSEPVLFKSVISMVVGSDNKETGSIVTSDADINRLFSNIVWGMRGNYLSVPTDCPQRNERLGWTGDTQIFIGTGSFNADVASFFRKWTLDCIDSQADDGAYPDVIPKSNATGAGAAAWGDAGIIVPYEMYLKYGDLWLLKRNYRSMEEYMRFLINNGGASGRYGDWLAYEPTDAGLISKAYFAYDAKLMSEISRILGNGSKASYYSDLYETVKAEFISDYLPSGQIGTMSQTAAIMTLKAGLYVDDKTGKTVLNALDDNISFAGGRLQTGFVGTADIVKVLSENGLDQTAYTLLLQRNNPSWLYSLDQGATTMWERWDSYTLERGFGDVGMNSFNHYAYGCVGECMYVYMSGINGYSSCGFKHFELSPHLDPEKRITSVSSEYDSIYGLVRSSWELSEDNIKFEFTVPANTSATVKLPANVGNSVYSKLKAGDNAVKFESLTHNSAVCEGLIYTGTENGYIILEAVSGTYRLFIE